LTPEAVKRTISREERIQVANSALTTFIPGCRLYQGERELRMTWGERKVWDFPSRLNSNGNQTEFGYRQRPTGGTGMQALAQLIRYARDLTRLPLSTFEYWSGDRVKLCKPTTVEILAAGDYGDPKKTCCVLCGAIGFIGDWWSLDKVVGPCCSWSNPNGCKQEKGRL
jgi:hypothetical protein